MRRACRVEGPIDRRHSGGDAPAEGSDSRVEIGERSCSFADAGHQHGRPGVIPLWIVTNSDLAAETICQMVCDVAS